MSDTNYINDRIRTLRIERKLTQQELGELLGITAQAVSKWETGQATPDITLLPKLSVLFSCSIDSLFNNTKATACSQEIKSIGQDRQRPGVYCSFCGKHQAEVWRMIAGPGVDICSECVEMCENILKQMKEEV